MKKSSKSSATRKKPSTPSRRSSKKAVPSIPKLALQKDLADFVASCLSHKVDFLIVGGYAVALHGYPRFRKDIGVSENEVACADILKPDYAIQVGRPPNRGNGAEYAEARF